MAADRERHWPEPEPDELLTALRSAGWLLEQEAATALSEAGFDVTPSWAYQDPDMPEKSREVDVVGIKQVLHDEDSGLTVTAYVLIECKESTMPYALVGRTVTPSDSPIERVEVQYHFMAVEVEREPTPRGLMSRQVGTTEYLGLHELTANPWARDFEATLLIRLNKKAKTWEAENDGLMQDVMLPMAKAVSAMRAAVSNYNVNGLVEGNGHSRSERGEVALYFPMLVTTAPLSRVDAGGAEVTTASAPWVTLKRRFASRTVQGEFRATVVNHKALGIFLQNEVLRFSDAVATVVLENPARLLNAIDHSWRRDGSPE